MRHGLVAPLDAHEIEQRALDREPQTPKAGLGIEHRVGLVGEVLRQVRAQRQLVGARCEPAEAENDALDVGKAQAAQRQQLAGDGFAHGGELGVPSSASRPSASSSAVTALSKSRVNVSSVFATVR